MFGEMPVEDHVQAFKDWFGNTFHLDLGSYKTDLMNRQIARALGASSHRVPDSASGLLRKILIDVSGYFRDPEEFGRLRDFVIPSLSAIPTPRILSVGCANGAELYSVAMLMAERETLEKSMFLGVDFNPHNVEAARSGMLNEKEKTSIPEPFRTRFLVSVGEGCWKLAPALRAQVSFRCLDALREPLGQDWDLILCRNVMIYLVAAARNRLLEACRAGLKPGGVLMLGRAERIIGPKASGWEALSPHLYRKNFMPETTGKA